MATPTPILVGLIAHLFELTLQDDIAETIQQGSPYDEKRNAGSSFTTRLHSAPKPRIAITLHAGYLAEMIEHFQTG